MSAVVSMDDVRSQTLAVRTMFGRLAATKKAKADVIPPTWNNNIRWHVGHMVTTPRLLTFGLLKEPLGIPAEYRTWYSKGTSPKEWGSAPVPPIEQLLEELGSKTREVFDQMEGRFGEAFPEPYTTSVGITLKTPGEALSFSIAHDGIHLGLMLALVRSL